MEHGIDGGSTTGPGPTPEHAPVPTPGLLPGVLADRTRRRCFAAVTLGAADVDHVVAATGTRPRQVRTAIQRLVEAGLLRRDGGLRVDEERLRQWARDARQAPASASAEDFPHETPERAQVLATFVRGGRLTSMPTSAAKRAVVLDHVAQDFEPGVRYLERDVNDRLQRWYDDHVTLRRYLVDGGQLSREAGEYWRSGGPV
jgi:hypothetical protein